MLSYSQSKTRFKIRKRLAQMRNIDAILVGIDWAIIILRYQAGAPREAPAKMFNQFRRFLQHPQA